jgi:hypothetical protein
LTIPLPNSNAPSAADDSLLTLLLAEKERRARARDEAATPSYTIPERNIRVYGGSKGLWESPDPRIIIAGPADCSKTYSLLHLLDWYCWQYKDLICAIIRKVHADMPSTVLQSWERKVIHMPKGESVAPGGIYKQGGESPLFYQYPTGSRVFVAGIDRPGKVLSGEIDLAVCNQTEEFELEDWETLGTRTSGRAGGLSPGRLLGDANPGPSTHWIKVAEREGKLRFIEARHEDNPELYDHDRHEWTEEGERRLAILRMNTGVRLQRLYYGNWVSAEGTVFQAFPTIDKPFAPIVRRIGSVDWGWTNPGALQVWGIDGDQRMYREVEQYQTQVPVALQNFDEVFRWDTTLNSYIVDYVALDAAPDCWVKRALILQRDFNVETWQCDPSRPEFITAFQQAGLNAVGAHNAIIQGIQWVEQRQVVAGDGFPRIALLRGSKPSPDPLLVERHLPTCLEDEVEVYAYPKDKTTGKSKRNENPVDAFNHACDITRYACSYIDSGGGFFFA